jgi:hypothetical protein
VNAVLTVFLVALVDVLALAVIALSLLLRQARRAAAHLRTMAGVYHTAVHRLTADFSATNAQLELYRAAEAQAIGEYLQEGGGQS